MDRPLLALTRRRFRWRRGEPASAADSENMRLLIQLRWVAVCGQLLTILGVAYGLNVPLPLTPMLAIVAAAALVNLASMPLVDRVRVRRLELLLALLFDVGLLAMQLYFSGGVTNPFVSLFLLQVVLGAILLGRRGTWVIVAATTVSYAILATQFQPLRYPRYLLANRVGLYLLGSGLCFALVGVLLVLFVTRIIRNLRVRDEGLADMRQQAAEEDHLVRMGLFASGAAHELGTPLATLAVILGDWRRMSRLADDPELIGEIAEMQMEVQRCKAIVNDVLQSVGELSGAAPDIVETRAFLREVVASWRVLHGTTPLVYRDELTNDLAIAADPAIRQAIWNVLDNAAEVSPDGVGLMARVAQGALLLSVRDRGPGFSPAGLADFGKPQQSEKGSGHGVGLFLVASVVRKIGGTVAARNRSGGGAEVTINLPLAAIGLKE